MRDDGFSNTMIPDSGANATLHAPATSLATMRGETQAQRSAVAPLSLHQGPGGYNARLGVCSLSQNWARTLQYAVAGDILSRILKILWSIPGPWRPNRS